MTRIKSSYASARVWRTLARSRRAAGDVAGALTAARFAAIMEGRPHRIDRGHQGHERPAPPHSHHLSRFS